MTNETKKPADENYTESKDEAGRVAIDACDADVQDALRALNLEDDEIVLEPADPVNGREVFAIRCTDLGMQALNLVFEGKNARNILRANALAKATRLVLMATTEIVTSVVDGNAPVSDVAFVSGLATALSTGTLDGVDAPKDPQTVLGVAAAYKMGAEMAASQLPNGRVASAVSDALAPAMKEFAKSLGIDAPTVDDAEGECSCEACTMRREMAAKAGMTVDELDELMAMTKTVGEA